MRLIDAEALIQLLRTCADDDWNKKTPSGSWSDAYEEMILHVEDMPTIEPEPQWIPCSERLPDIKEHHVSKPCIVYCENGAYSFAELEENIVGQVGWNCERDDEYHEPLGDVLAWMPLPSPYREEGEE